MHTLFMSPLIGNHFKLKKKHFESNCISSVIVSILNSSVIDHGGSATVVSNQTIKLVFVPSPLSMQPQGVRAKTGWLVIRIMCQSGVTLSTCTDCCFSELALYKFCLNTLV
jgi:hypothetical protein